VIFTRDSYGPVLSTIVAAVALVTVYEAIVVPALPLIVNAPENPVPVPVNVTDWRVLFAGNAVGVAVKVPAALAIPGSKQAPTTINRNAKIHSLIFIKSPKKKGLSY
jgi:hypothetical protein